MRYAGGILGGTWPALLASDLGAGTFDGAHLVENFEYLNPGNTYFNKYYTLFSKIDTEPERFLEFERWWGGFFLMDRQEIKWIVENLFVGQQPLAGRCRVVRGTRLRPAGHQVADHPVRVARRQHHAAAAGVQLGCRPLSDHGRPQGEWAGDRWPDAQERRPSRHLRFRPGCQARAHPDRRPDRVHRASAPRTLRHAGRGAEDGRERALRCPADRAAGRGPPGPAEIRPQGRDAVRDGRDDLRGARLRLRNLRPPSRFGDGDARRRGRQASHASPAGAALGGVGSQSVPVAAQGHGRHRAGEPGAARQ